MNKEIYEILEKIENKGYEAYVVGGYVRDFLLGKISNDIDICTSMPFSDLKEIFKQSISYDDYLCVKFKIKENNYSITVYRRELKYNKNKPIELEYTAELKQDLLRRDFTINAICLNKDNEIIDLLSGIKDLKSKIIKVIGDTSKKLTEDNTRILRALKYASVLKFNLYKELDNFIINNSVLLETIPVNKVKSELDIIFSTNCVQFLKYVKDNNIDIHLGFQVTQIVDTKKYLEVWSSLKLLKVFPFTKEEKKCII